MTERPTVSVSEFLSAFFPDENEQICLRNFKPKGAPKGFTIPYLAETTRKELATDKKTQEQLRQFNERSGIYFIVNSGGHNDESITRYNAFFVESDSAPMDEQHALLDATRLQPNIRVETGKSVHAYWLIKGECSEADWRDIQARLIAYFDGDAMNKNPSRCMRLPHFNHVTYHEEDASLAYKRVEIAKFNTEPRYSVAQMLTEFPAPKHEEKEQPVKERVDLLIPSNSQFFSWEELNDELRRRIMQAGKKNSKGKYEMRCPAHNGQGETSLFFNPANDAVKCMDGCSHEQLLVAFGLPAQPKEPKLSIGSKGKSKAANQEGNDDAIEDIDVCMAEVEPQEVEWLIEPYIPLGKLTIVEGDPDEGKSFATLAIATAITKGYGLPFGEIVEAGNILLLSAEDGRADTIRPRLDSLGADVSRVFAVTAPLVLNARGFEQLEKLIVKRQAKMVLFDPLFAYVGGRADINQDNRVREITTPLADIAERHNCAIVAIRHLPKAQQRNAKTAGSNSIAWTAAVRSVLLFGHEPEDEQARGFVHTKHNLSKKGAAQGYRIDEIDGKVQFRWTGKCDLTAEKILGSQNFNDAGKSEIKRAEDFLFDTLQGGAKLQKEIQRLTKQARISPATLRRAKKNLLVVSYQPIPKGAWWWKLPDAQGSNPTDEHVDSQGSSSVSATVNADVQAQVMSM